MSKNNSDQNLEIVREKINNMPIIQVPEATNIQPTHKANAEKERH